MYTFNEVEHININEIKAKHVKKEYDTTELLLVGDIGGTHCNFAIVKTDQKQFQLVISLHFLSKEITRFVDVICWILEHLEKKYTIKTDKACFASAGPVGIQGDVVLLTNLPWNIDLKELKEHTSLKNIKVINDFEAIAYGIDLIDQKDVICIYDGQKLKNKHNKIIIGAGTGLGKCIVTWDENRNDYSSMPSEGGHADFPVYNQDEFRLLEYIKDKNKKTIISWEDVLSGKGIGIIYKFLLSSNPAFTSNSTIIESDYEASVIAAHKETDPCAQETFSWFTRFYGRCAKNFALETLALGGVYIAGGIAAKNPDIFRKEPFVSEFLKHETMQFVLEKIPIYVVVDYKVSLYGAAKGYFR